MDVQVFHDRLENPLNHYFMLCSLDNGTETQQDHLIVGKNTTTIVLSKASKQVNAEK